MKELWMDRFFSRYPPHFRHPPHRVADGGFKLTSHFQLPNSLSYPITIFQNYDQIIFLFILNRES